jgi:acyl-CoA thioesterase
VSRLVPTEWVLLDIQVHAVQHGFGHGLVHLWAQDGTLLAIASQSCIVRTWSDEGRKAFLATKEEA